MSRNKKIPNRLSTLRNCISGREALLKEGKLSVPAGEGFSIIVTSGRNREEKEVLEEHAADLSCDVSGAFFGALIRPQVRLDNIIDMVNDPEVTSMAFLGDGSFGSYNISVPRSDYVETLTWDLLAGVASHLKQGVIEQRTCTMIHRPEREVRVALPSFIVADQRKILSSVNQTFDTFHGHEVFTRFVHPVYENPSNSEEQLRHPAGFQFKLAS